MRSLLRVSSKLQSRPIKKLQHLFRKYRIFDPIGTHADIISHRIKNTDARF